MPDTFAPFDADGGLIFAAPLQGSPEAFNGSRLGWEDIAPDGPADGWSVRMRAGLGRPVSTNVIVTTNRGGTGTPQVTTCHPASGRYGCSMSAAVGQSFASTLLTAMEPVNP